MSASSPSSSPLVIRDVVLFTPQGRLEGDCLVEGGRIAALGQVSAPRGAHEVLGRRRWLWPGAIDAHVHMRTPGATHKEDWRSGSAAAAAGGVTCALDMPNTTPSTTTVEALEAKRALIQSQTRINFGLFFGATPSNLDQIQLARGICGLKIFMASSTGDLLVAHDHELEPIFAAFEGQISVHAEDEARILARQQAHAEAADVRVHSVIRDPEAARQGIERAGRLANRYGRRLHVLHLSTRAELDALKQAQRDAADGQTGAVLTAEVCPHHLYLSTRDYAPWGAFVQMNPPLRDEEDRLAMWQALSRGELDLVATDHAPHLPEEKLRGYPRAPAGVPGVQAMLPLMLHGAHQGWVTYEQVLELVCHGPARVYALRDRGRLQVGAWADLTLIDPDLERTMVDEDQRSRCGWTPYRAMRTRGWPVGTWVNGHLVFWREGGSSGQIMTDQPVGVSAF